MLGIQEKGQTRNHCEVWRKGGVQIKKVIYFLLHPVSFFWMAVVLIIVSRRYRPLWEQSKDPFGFLIGAVVGVIVYYWVVALVGWKLPGVREYLREIRRSFTHTCPSTRRIIMFGGRAIYEEAFWRGTVQVLLGQGIFAVFLTALLFTLRHIYLYFKRQPLAVPLLLEFFLFSLFLGALYRLSDRIMLVVAIHFMRNLLVAAGRSFPEREIAVPHHADDHG